VTGRRASVVVLMARAGSWRYPGAEDAFYDLVFANFPECEIQMFVGDTEQDASHDAGARFQVLLSNSVDREWGCWDDLIRSEPVRRALDGSDYVVMCTAAFANDYVGYLNNLTLKNLSKLALQDFVMGHVDYYDFPVKFDGISFQYWLRTSAFVVTPSVLREISPITTPLPSDTSLFADNHAAPFASSGAVSSGYADYIMGWLTRTEGTGQGTSRAVLHELTPEGALEFRSKCRAMFREQLLTRRLEVSAFPILDANFVEGVRGMLVRPVPWQAQLRLRVVDSTRPLLGPARALDERVVNQGNGPTDDELQVTSALLARRSVARPVTSGAHQEAFWREVEETLTARPRVTGAVPMDHAEPREHLDEALAYASRLEEALFTQTMAQVQQEAQRASRSRWRRGLRRIFRQSHAVDPSEAIGERHHHG
jgi:hypothetical protein